MMDRTTMPRQPVVGEGPILADRVDAKIGDAEHDLETSSRELELAVVAEAQAKQAYAELRRLTSRIKNLAPLIREEVSSLERIWRSAAEKKLRLKATLESAHKELARVRRAREQLKQIGFYHPAG